MRNEQNETTSTNVATATVIVADSLSLPHPSHIFDFAICIAVIHHLSTRDRRVIAIREILRTLRRPQDQRCERGSTKGRTVQRAGQALLFVWALEQKSSRRGWSAGDEQDQLVPWVLKNNDSAEKQGKNKKTRGRLRVEVVGGEVGAGDEARGVERSEAERSRGDPGTTAPVSNVGVASGAKQIRQGEAAPDHVSDKTNASQAHTLHRFYHLYAESELEGECAEAGAVVVESGYDRDNWWVVIEAGDRG